MKFTHLTAALIGLVIAGCGGSDFPPVNTEPTISEITDKTTSANETSSAIAFTVADEQVSTLSLSAISDNQQLVPDTGLVIVGNGANRFLNVTPSIDSLGDAYITIIATDQAGLSAGSTFLLTVDPQQLSMQQFARTTYLEDESDDPALINAVEFDQDADDDDFADLLGQ